jgi:hypothetical protein
MRTVLFLRSFKKFTGAPQYVELFQPCARLPAPHSAGLVLRKDQGGSTFRPVHWLRGAW